MKKIKLRRNLMILTGAEISNLVVKDPRVQGVRYIRQDQEHIANANIEVLFSAGTVNSTKILELSGIGRPDILQKFDIPVQHALSGVGENLQNHLQIRTVFKINNASTLNGQVNSLVGKLKMGLQYLLFQNRPLSMARSQLGLFSESDSQQLTPKLEYHIQPLSTDKLGEPLHPFEAITASLCNLRPDSRGSIQLQSSDFRQRPSIKTNYLSAESDRLIAAESIRLTRNIMQAKAVLHFQLEKILPGPSIANDEALAKASVILQPLFFTPLAPAKWEVSATRRSIND